MIFRKLVQTGNDQDDIRRLIHAINVRAVALPFPAIGSLETVAAGATTDFGGIAVDRSVFRQLLPDSRWLVYAAGEVDPGDANIATVSLIYQPGNPAVAAGIVLGSITRTGLGNVKAALGPFDVFATPTVPAGETIPIIRLRVNKNAGAAAELRCWNVWLRLLPAKQ